MKNKIKIKIKKIYLNGLSKELVKKMTVFRLSVVFTPSDSVFPGEVHQYFFKENDGFLYTYLNDLLDLNWDILKIEKL